MEGMSVVLVSTVTALIVSIVGTLVTSGLESRRKIDDTIRENRMVGYRLLWEKTRLFPRWPRGTVTRRQIRQLSEEFRDWYYEGHGMYLSASSRKIYGDVQKMLVAVAAESDDLLPEPGYDSLRDHISALRTALTNDLLSRTRPVVFRRNKEA